MTDTTMPDVGPGPAPDAAPDLAPDPLPGGAPAGGPPLRAVDEEAEERRMRRRRALLVFLIAILGAFLLFAGWYLLNRKPISELPLPGVTTEDMPHYAFSIYGVNAPTGVAVNADGSRIYATQTEGQTKVIAFDGSGNPVAELAPPADITGNHVPVYVAISPTSGDVYVTDRASGDIYVYAPDGTFKETFDPGATLKGWAPLGIAFDTKGSMYVTNLGAPFQAVHRFDPDGTLAATYGKPNQFNFPNGVAVDAAGYVYVTDSNNGRMVVFDPSGTEAATIKRGAAQADLGLPRGNAVDSEGRVYVADVSAQSVQVYRELASGERTPAYLGHFGVEGSGDGAFLFPNAVAVDGRARVYIADWRNGRIQVWTY